MSKKWTTTADFILNGKFQSGAPAGLVLLTEGFNVVGDGAGGRWVSTGNTIAASQTPTNLGENKLSDARGNEFEFVDGQVQEYTGTKYYPGDFGGAGNGSYIVSAGSWSLVNSADAQALVQVNTFAELEALSPSEDGLTPKRYICVERSNAEYLLQPSGYVALTGDVTFANGRVAALQIGDTVFAEKFGVISNSTIQVAVDRAALAGVKYVNVKNTGSPIAISSAISKTNASIDIDFCGNILYPTSSAFSVVSFSGSFDLDFDDVVGLSYVKPESITVSAIETPSASLFSVGDVVKLGCSDLIPTLHDEHRKLGQYAVVTSISGNLLILDSLIYEQELYINDLRVGRLANYSYAIRNLNITNPDSVMPVRLLSVFSSKNCEFENCYSSDALSPFIQPTNVYKYTVTGGGATNSGDNASSGIFGYGVDDRSSYQGRVYSFNCTKGRHSVTTNARWNPDTGSNLETGRTYNLEVHNSTTVGSTSTAFDTHPGAVYTNFINCTAINCYAVIGGRAPKTKAVNPVSIGCERFIQLYPSFDAGNGVDIDVINPSGNCDEYINYTMGGSLQSSVDMANIRSLGGKVKINNLDRGSICNAYDTANDIAMPINLSIRTDFHGDLNGGTSGAFVYVSSSDNSSKIFMSSNINIDSVITAPSGTMKIIGNRKTDTSVATVADTTVTGELISIFRAVENMSNRISNLRVMTSNASFSAGNGTALTFTNTI